MPKPLRNQHAKFCERNILGFSENTSEPGIALCKIVSPDYLQNAKQPNPYNDGESGSFEQFLFRWGDYRY